MLNNGNVVIAEMAWSFWFKLEDKSRLYVVGYIPEVDKQHKVHPVLDEQTIDPTGYVEAVQQDREIVASFCDSLDLESEANLFRDGKLDHCPLVRLIVYYRTKWVVPENHVLIKKMTTQEILEKAEKDCPNVNSRGAYIQAFIDLGIALPKSDPLEIIADKVGISVDIVRTIKDCLIAEGFTDG